MDIAITVGAYQLTEFVELNLSMLRQLFGNDVPILVSDDLSIKSPGMRWLAHKYGADYVCSEARRSHFAGDAQAVINALAFARANECEIALKISQRVVLQDPASREIITRPFLDEKICLALPGRLNVNKLRPEHRMYGSFLYLTDLVAIRTAALSAEEIMEKYRDKVRGASNRSDAYVERLFLELVRGPFEGRTHIYHEFTDHVVGEPFKFLRKCQNDQIQYQKLAAGRGIHGLFSLQDWKYLDPDYQPHPKVV